MSIQKWYQGRDAVLNGKLGAKYKKIEPIIEAMASGRKVLDIGCNGGLVSTLSAKHGAEKVFGIDKRPQYIDQANMGAESWAKKGFLKNRDNISFFNGSLNDNLSLVDDSDFIIMIRVIYHLRDDVLNLMDKIKDREDMIMLIQGNPARRDKAKLEKTKLGNKLALSDAIVSFVESYNFVAIKLKNEVVIAKHKNSSFDLDKIKARCTAR